MLGKLFILFTVLPAIDLYVLIKVGVVIGAGPALAFAVVMGLLGAYLAKREGLRVWREWQEAVTRGEMPREGVTSSLLVLVGGVLLVTPGFITDIAGMLLLIPPTRRVIAKWVIAYAQKRLEAHTVAAVGPSRIIDVDARDSE